MVWKENLLEKINSSKILTTDNQKLPSGSFSFLKNASLFIKKLLFYLESGIYLQPQNGGIAQLDRAPAF